MLAQTLAVSTVLTTFVRRRYAGGDYPRTTRVFGDKEPVVLYLSLMNNIALPVQNAPVTLELDGHPLATVYTDLGGGAGYLFNTGIRAGNHVITASWQGDFWNGPSQSTLTLQTVSMTQAYFKSYVDIVAVSAGTVEADLMRNMLNQEIGAVLTKIEADLDRSRYIITILVPEESTTPTLGGIDLVIAEIVAIMLALAAVLTAASIIIYVTISYVYGQYQCGVCGETFVTCESLREHLIVQHPAEWTEIQDRFDCTIPTPNGTLILYAAVGIGAVIAVAYVIQTLKKR